MSDPRRPRTPKDDDDAAGLPTLDGAEHDTALETAVDLDVRDDEASALDDRASSDLEGAIDDDLDAGPTTVAVDDEGVPPLEADPSLGAGETERWTEGSDASEDVPWQEKAVAETSESSLDGGEEGFDESAAAAGDALPGLPAAHAGDADDDADDALDVSEAGALETSSTEPERTAALPRADVTTRWHGPPREAARAIAVLPDRSVLIGARGLYRVEGDGLARREAFEAEVSALVAFADGQPAWIGSDAGEVFRRAGEGAVERQARPGTDDASLGALDLARVGDVVVARTRGGALFRAHDAGWVGPIVAKNVRRVRGGIEAGTDWLALVVGSAASPELLATRDARTFERMRSPEGEGIVEAARSGDVIALASAGGKLLVSRDAGASYRAVEGVVDVEHVWAHASGLVLAATFHEATDQGRLVRVREGAADVLLDLESELAARRLSGPGEQDGDGHVHALAHGAGTLWVATGVGVFSLPLALEASPTK